MRIQYQCRQCPLWATECLLYVLRCQAILLNLSVSSQLLYTDTKLRHIFRHNLVMYAYKIILRLISEILNSISWETWLRLNTKRRRPFSKFLALMVLWKHTRWGQLSMRCKYKHGIILISSPLYTSVAIMLDYAPHFSWICIWLWYCHASSIWGIPFSLCIMSGKQEWP